MANDLGNGDVLPLPVGKEEVDRLIRENKQIFSDTQCKVCNAALISESQKLAHYQSKKHANKMRRYMSGQQGEDNTPVKKMKTEHKESSNGEDDRNKHCPICNMSFTSPVVAQSHYEGKPHSKNLKLKEQGAVPEAAKKVAKIEEKVDQSDAEKYCKICNSTFNNPQMAQQHYMGKKHKKHETKNQLMTIYSSTGKAPTTQPLSTSVKKKKPSSVAPIGKGYSCDTCNLVLNSIEQYQAHISGAKHKNHLEGKPSKGFKQQGSSFRSFGPPFSTSERVKKSWDGAEKRPYNALKPQTSSFRDFAPLSLSSTDYVKNKWDWADRKPNRDLKPYVSAYTEHAPPLLSTTSDYLRTSWVGAERKPNRAFEHYGSVYKDYAPPSYSTRDYMRSDWQGLMSMVPDCSKSVADPLPVGGSSSGGDALMSVSSSKGALLASPYTSLESSSQSYAGGDKVGADNYDYYSEDY